MISLRVHTISCTIIMFAIILKCLGKKQTNKTKHPLFLAGLFLLRELFHLQVCSSSIYRCATSPSTGVHHHHLQVCIIIYRCAAAASAGMHRHLHVYVVTIYMCASSSSTGVKQQHLQVCIIIVVIIIIIIIIRCASLSTGVRHRHL